MSVLKNLFTCWGFLILADFCASGAQTDAFDFSAQRITRVGDKFVTEQVYARDDRWRLEYAQPQAGAMAAIVRDDIDHAWLLFSRMRRYVEVEITDNMLLMVDEKMPGEVSREFVGSEDLNGFPVELFEVTVERDGRQLQYYQWVTRLHRFAIKTVSKDGDHRVEYRHLNFAKQPDLYFELPIGYKRDKPQNPN